MKCSWMHKDVACTTEATRELHDKNGKVWSHLCDEHFKRHDDAIASFDAKRILASWVCASGGAKVLAESMRPGIQKGVQAIVALAKLSGAAKAGDKARPGESTADYVRRVLKGT